MKQQERPDVLTWLPARQSAPRFFCMVMSMVCFAMMVGGCIAVPRGPVSRFYVLEEVQGNQTGKTINNTFNKAVAIGPVHIPEYQQRPQMVTKNKEKRLTFAQFDRWGEALDVGVARLIREHLTDTFQAATFTLYPWNVSIPVTYQVVVEFVQMESDLDKDLFVVAQWMVVDVEQTKTKIIRRSTFRQPIIPQNYAGLAKTLSIVCGSLSNEIAAGLATMETQQQ